MVRPWERSHPAPRDAAGSRARVACCVACSCAPLLPAERSCPHDPPATPRTRLHRTPYPGGAPANVATGVARLGAGSLFLSAIGDDDLGDQFVALLKGEQGWVAAWEELRGQPAALLQWLC